MTGTDRTPAALVTAFLAAMEERDLARASTYLADTVALRFPNGAFDSLDAMVASAGGRYRWVKKRIDTTDSFSSAGVDVVYVSGTLYGVNLHDLPFDGIRFIDRFELRGGKITVQDVWNDLAESGVLARGA